MGKARLIMCLLLASSASLSSPKQIECKNRFPMGRDPKTVIFKLSRQADQTYTAELEILTWDDKPFAHETLTNLECDFSDNSSPVTRCNFKSSHYFAFVLEVIRTVKRELRYGPADELIGGVDVETTEVSLTLDAVRDGMRIPYGYGDILFMPDECKIN